MRLSTPFATSLLVLAASAAATVLTPRPAPATASRPAPVQNGSYHIDGGHSSVIFEVVHLGISPFFGRFNTVEGVFVIDEDPANSSVRIEIDAASVDTNSVQRDSHLKSPDFFNAAQYPKVVFESDSIEKQDGDVYHVVGTLDLHGVQAPVEAKMRLIGAGDKGGQFGYRAGFGGSFTFDRTDFGVGGKFPTDLLSNEVTLRLGIEGVKQ